MNLRPDEITSVIRHKISEFEYQTDTSEESFVISAGDGIARIFGLENCMSGELLEFENGIMGMALNLEEDNIGAVLLGDPTLIREGCKVKRTGRQVEIPVGEQFLGRVINPLGEPIDGLNEEIIPADHRPIEYPAPGVVDRKSVNQPLQTGILAIDSMIPIGRGQRELIIGDRQTGKTTIAVDTIINQKDSGVICIYVAIGQKASTIAGIVDTLKKHDAMDYTIVLASTASDPFTLQYIAPYAGCAMAEYFMYNLHKDVLIVYDDLSKHAVSYRTLSLLLRRPPGREAYPGDVFYLHSRLLERAAKLSDELGGGSITALPIIETNAGDISAYIPTNVISITDGQIFLETELFYSGQRPAINVGISVSRVGNSAQIPAMKKAAGSLRIDLAQYRELSVFSQFGSDLDKQTLDTLNRGSKLFETLKQPQSSPWKVEEQVLLLHCATGKYLMDIDKKDVAKFNRELIKYVSEFHAKLFKKIVSEDGLSAETKELMDNVITEFKQRYLTGEE